jgi:hypothetical protein
MYLSLVQVFGSHISKYMIKFNFAAWGRLHNRIVIRFHVVTSDYSFFVMCRVTSLLLVIFECILFMVSQRVFVPCYLLISRLALYNFRDSSTDTLHRLLCLH